MTRIILYSLAICAAGTTAEGILAGRGVRQRLASLRLPRFAPPFAVWVGIGVLYYAICFAVSFRLFLSPSTPWRSAAFVLLAFFMSINAVWNYFFFRTRNLSHAYHLGFPYSAIALSLFLVLLLRVDRLAAFCFLPYLAYLAYATCWSYRVWKLNP